jgi:beta-glucosidase
MHRSSSEARGVRLAVENLEHRLLPSTSAYVAGLYQVLLRRTPRASEVAPDVPILNSGAQTPTQVALDITGSGEFLTDLVVADYQRLLGRSPVVAETIGCLELLEARGTSTQLAATLLSSPEYVQKHGGTAGGWVTAVYQDVLGRFPTASELAGAVPALQTGASSPAAFALAVLQSAESEVDIATAAYAQVLGGSPDPRGLAVLINDLAEGLSPEQLQALLASTATFINTEGGLDVVPAPDVQATTPLAIPAAGAAYYSVRELQNEIRAAQGHAPILFLGDSITDFFANGAGAPVWDTFLAPLGAVDFGIAGISTGHVLWQVATGQVAALSPNVVVLMIGTNNLTVGQSPQAVAAGIADIVAGIQAGSPGTRILLLGILPRGTTAADPLRVAVAGVNTAIAGLADGQHIFYLDIGRAFLLPGGTLSPAAMADGIHPTLLGYQIWTEAIWQTLLTLVAG